MQLEGLLRCAPCEKNPSFGLISLLRHYEVSPGTRKFVTEEAKFKEDEPIYSFVQCTPDIAATDCGQCLRKAISHLPGCCEGKIGGRVLLPSCFIRYEMYPFFDSGLKGAKFSASSLRTVIIVASTVVAVVLLTVTYWVLSKKKVKKHSNITMDSEKIVDSKIFTLESLRFSLGAVKAATNDFSDNNKLGEGGFGAVYKGIIRGGQEIAAKRLSKRSGQGAEEFKNEVESVAKLQHRNLVRLLGFCLEGEEKILVYEFVPNRSLDFHLFDSGKKGQLHWRRRHKIIVGIARGLLYLHEDSRLRVVHRDLKASNILLDGDMDPKISDFGTARIFGMDQTQGNTNRIVGTYGYMSPEYVTYGNFSVKSDVFSFGVLILEIISGKKNSCSYQSEFGKGLLDNVWRHWKDGTYLEIVDPTLRESYTVNEVIRCIHIALLCVQEDMEDRPTIASVVLMLNSDTIALPLPQQPAFTSYRDRQPYVPISASSYPVTLPETL